MRKGILAVAVMLALALVVNPASAQVVPVDLELSLLVDVSGSVSTSEFNLQRQGYVDAFKNSTIVNAITSGDVGAIAVNFIYWSGSAQQQTAVGWTYIDDAASAAAFADAILATSRPYSGVTAPGSAINYAVPLFNNGYDGTKLVIDVSGDGKENNGADTATARDAAAALGITINGIVILGESNLEPWYNENVKTSDGFVIAASDFASFGSTLEEKLEREIDDDDDDDDDDEPVIPEPATMLLFGAGLLGFVGLRRKK